MPWKFDRKILHDGLTNIISFTFQGHKIILKPLSPKEVNKDQIKMKTKRENEKDKERKDKPGNNTSPHTEKNNHVDPYRNANCTSSVLLPYLFHYLMLLNT